MRRAALALVAVALTVGGLSVGQPSGSSAAPAGGTVPSTALHATSS
jgi:hypothetical protein